jgi:hypothetical protein
MNPNPLNNGSLSVAVAGRGSTEHAFSIREKATVCGVTITRSNQIKDFPMHPDKACAPCLVGLMTAAVAPKEATS